MQIVKLLKLYFWVLLECWIFILENRYTAKFYSFRTVKSPKHYYFKLTNDFLELHYHETSFQRTLLFRNHNFTELHLLESLKFKLFKKFHDLRKYKFSCPTVQETFQSLVIQMKHVPTHNFYQNDDSTDRGFGKVMLLCQYAQEDIYTNFKGWFFCNNFTDTVAGLL